MAEEKTEEATPKRKQKEREKGNISRSNDLNSAISITVGVSLLVFMMPKIMDALQNIMKYAFTHLDPKNIEMEDIRTIIAPYFQVCSDILIPFFITMFFVIIIVMRMQIGHLFAIEKLKPSLEKFAPSSMAKSLGKIINPFDPKNMVELLKSLAKLFIVGAFGYSAVAPQIPVMMGLMGIDTAAGLDVLGQILLKMVTNVCIAMLLIGFLDKKYSDYQYNKALKMTKQEIKDEWKNVEGDPKIKAKIKQMSRQILQQKMMSAVPKADVVVVNPTHYAVAIKYDINDAPAPIVVAKGVDYIAFKIREIATNNNIPIVENKPLARALYKLVDINSIIPAELYVAVAKVLSYVYNRNGRVKR